MALNITDSLTKAIAQALKDLYGIEQAADGIVLQDTRREFRGDYTLVVFPYVKAGKYCVRITEDRNGNGLVDTGSLLERRQPEKVKFYKIKDDFLLDIPERTEYQQKINMKELFQ